MERPWASIEELEDTPIMDKHDKKLLAINAINDSDGVWYLEKDDALTKESILETFKKVANLFGYELTGDLLDKTS
jgi:hypothetical protein